MMMTVDLLDISLCADVIAARSPLTGTYRDVMMRFKSCSRGRCTMVTSGSIPSEQSPSRLSQAPVGVLKLLITTIPNTTTTHAATATAPANSPGETVSVPPVVKTSKMSVKRRLLIAIAETAATIAFAIVHRFSPWHQVHQSLTHKVYKCAHVKVLVIAQTEFSLHA